MSAEEVLRERARRLAQREDLAEEHGLPLTLFLRAGLLVGVRVEEVAGAGTLRQLTRVPGAPPWVAGAVFHRGEVLTLIDLPLLWGLPVQGIADLPTYVVLTDGTRRVGVPVEEVRGVVEVTASVAPWRGAPRVGLAEVTHLGAQAVHVLRAQALLADSGFAG